MRSRIERTAATDDIVNKQILATKLIFRFFVAISNFIDINVQIERNYILAK